MEDPTIQKPSVGRIVLVHGAPAIVTKVNEDGSVNLRVFEDGPPHNAEFIQETKNWIWPPRI